MESDNKKEYDDVNGYFYDIKSEQAYINKLLTKLYELDVYKPKKLYPSIFYERYIEKQDMALIAKMHNISQNELNERILEIANYIAKD